MSAHITIVAVGRLKERFWDAACDEYLKRLRPYARIAIHEVPDRDPAKMGGDKQARRREADDILRAIPPEAQVILLAIEGEQRSSENFSAHIDELTGSGRSEIAFIIGGSTGVDESIMHRADECLSFGPITLPHNLARVVLLEQLYRACRISRRESYHK